MSNPETKKEIYPSFGLALATFLTMVAILMVGLLGFEADMHILLIICLSLVACVGIKIGFKWSEIEAGMVAGVHRAIQVLFFFILIGMIVASWVQSGTVPALIYYGLDILTPTFFLPAGLIICSIASLATGSSWNVAGTVGVALMGIGMGMGIPAPLVAGMVISGSYFGDKMSPLSDTTNLAPALAGTDVYSHIGAMLYTTIPAYILALIAYAVAGLKYAGKAIDADQIATIQAAISNNFDLNLIVLLPMVAVLVLSVAKFPAIPGLLVGIALGVPIAMFYQNVSFVDALATLNYGFEIETGVEMVDVLLNRGGIQSMMWTFSLAVIALALGGALTKTKIMPVIIDKILLKIASVRQLIPLTIFTCFIVNITMGEQYMSLVLNGELYRNAYEKMGLQPRMLSRAMEEGGTITSPFIPWTTCGAFMYGALGVYNFSFAPFAFFNIFNVALAIIFPLIGITILRANGVGKKIEPPPTDIKV